jgi:hypothetical protein
MIFAGMPGRPFAEPIKYFRSRMPDDCLELAPLKKERAEYGILASCDLPEH